MSYQTNQKSARLPILLIAAIVVVLGAIAYTVTSKKSDDKREVSTQETSRKHNATEADTGGLRAAVRKNRAKLKSESKEGFVDSAMAINPLIEKVHDSESEKFLNLVREKFDLTGEQEVQYWTVLARKREIAKKSMLYVTTVMEDGDKKNWSDDEMLKFLERIKDAPPHKVVGLTEDEYKIFDTNRENLLVNVLDERQKKLFGQFMEQRQEAQLEHDSASTLADIDKRLHLSSEQRDTVYEIVSRHGGENPPLSEMKEILNDWQWKRYSSVYNPASSQIRVLREESVGLTGSQTQKILQLGIEKERKLKNDELQLILTKKQYHAYKKQQHVLTLKSSPNVVNLFKAILGGE